MNIQKTLKFLTLAGVGIASSLSMAAPAQAQMSGATVSTTYAAASETVGEGRDALSTAQLDAGTKAEAKEAGAFNWSIRYQFQCRAEKGIQNGVALHQTNVSPSELQQCIQKKNHEDGASALKYGAGGLGGMLVLMVVGSMALANNRKRHQVKSSNLNI